MILLDLPVPLRRMDIHKNDDAEPTGAMTFNEMASAIVERIADQFGDSPAAAKALHKFGLTNMAKGGKPKKFQACKDCPDPSICKSGSGCGADRDRANAKKAGADLAAALARIRSEPPKPSADVIYAEMMKRAVALYPGTDGAAAFSKSLSNADQRRAYGEYRRAWNAEQPGRERAAEAARRAPVSKSAPDFGPSYAAIAKVGEEIRAANPKLSAEQAFSRACSTRPDLYAAYRADQRRRAS